MSTFLYISDRLSTPNSDKTVVASFEFGSSGTIFRKVCGAALCSRCLWKDASHKSYSFFKPIFFSKYVLHVILCFNAAEAVYFRDHLKCGCKVPVYS